MKKLKPLRFPEANRPRSFKIASWNIGAGELVKIQLEAMLSDESLDVLCIQEPFGSSETNPWKLNINKNYHYLFSKPSIVHTIDGTPTTCTSKIIEGRKKCESGCDIIHRHGLVTYVHKRYHYPVIIKVDSPISIETMVMNIIADGKKLTLLNTYVNHAARIRDVKSISSIFKGNNISPDYIGCGDYNSHHAYWNCAKDITDDDEEVTLEEINACTNSKGRALYDSMSEVIDAHFLNRYCDTGIHTSTYQNTIDLIVSSSSLAIKLVRVSILTEKSDTHYPVMATFNHSEVLPKKDFIPTPNYSKFDSQKFCEECEDLFAEIDTNSYKNTDSLLDDIILNIQKARDLATPDKKYSQHPHRKLWWNEECERARKRLRLAERKKQKYSKYQIFPRMKELELIRIREETYEIYEKAKIEAVKKYAGNLVFNSEGNSSLIWNGLKYAYNLGIPPLKSTSHDINPQLIIDEFADRCSDKVLRDNGILQDLERREPEIWEAIRLAQKLNADTDVPFTMVELNKVFAKRTKSSSGPDNINYSCTSNTGLLCRGAILDLYNRAFKERKFPNIFKLAHIVPVPKSDKKSFRPISLLSVLGKLFEKMILNRVMFVIQKLDPRMTGFIKNRSCNDSIAMVLATLTEILSLPKTNRALENRCLPTPAVDNLTDNDVNPTERDLPNDNLTEKDMNLTERDLPNDNDESSKKNTSVSVNLSEKDLINNDVKSCIKNPSSEYEQESIDPSSSEPDLQESIDSPSSVPANNQPKSVVEPCTDPSFIKLHSVSAQDMIKIDYGTKINSFLGINFDPKVREIQEKIHNRIEQIENQPYYENKKRKAHPQLIVFLDLMKAFELVRRSLAINALRRAGIKGRLLQILSDFMSNREYIVKAGGKFSKPTGFDNGCPQGSILGPLLFNILMHDALNDSRIKKISKKVLFQIYADDVFVSLKIRYRNFKQSFTEIQNALNIFAAVAEDRGLLVNPDKTKAIIIAGQSRAALKQKFQLTLRGMVIEYVDSYKYLGVIFDQDMTFYKHALYIKRTLTKKISLLKYLSYSGVPLKTLLIFYKAYIRSKMLYGLSIAPILCKNAIKIFEGIQNQCLRICLAVRNDTTVSTLIYETQCPPISEMMQLGLTQFLLKMKDRDQENPLLNLVMENTKYNSSCRNYLSWSEVATSMLQKIDIPFDYDSEPLRYSNPPWNEKYISFQSTEMPCAKSELTQEQCVSIRNNVNKDIISDLRDPSMAVIACDASVKDKKAAYGSILRYRNENMEISELKTGARLNCTVGSMTAELCGIRDSLKLLIHTLKSKIDGCSIKSLVLYTDSKCAWSSLQAGSTKDNYKINDEILILINALFSRQIELKFVWIPSHIGIMLNTEADALADMMHYYYEAPVLNIQPSVSIRMKAAFARLKGFRVCRDMYEDKRQFNRYLRINPELKSPVQTVNKRHIEILIHNIRLSYLDTCLFHHRNVTCHRCHEPFNVSHYLTECPETEELSEAVYDIIQVNPSMNCDDVAEKLLNFIAECDPASCETISCKLRHFYLMMESNPIRAGCPDGHSVIKKLSKYIK